MLDNFPACTNASMITLRPALQTWRSAYKLRVRCFTLAASPARLTLAYSLHEPPKQSQDNPAGNPIVFMHGLFGSKKNNRSMSKVVARDLNRPVYAIDLRNHGDSPHDAQHDYSALASDVEGFIDEHKLGNTTLIGHSMGAKVAMAVALHQPSIVANLVSIDNAPVDAALKSDFGKYMQGMKKIEEAKVQKQSEADDILKQYEDALPIRQFLLTNLVRSQPAGSEPTHLKFRIPLSTLAKSLDNMADFPYKDPETHRFMKPTLFVRGTKSHYVADETLPAIGNFFPRFELADVEAGHWIVSENPEAFRRIVVEWLMDKV